MTDIKAKTIADSIGEHSPRLFTIETRSPAMVHQEVLRHRRLITEEGLSVLSTHRVNWEPDFSYSVSSTRAVPFPKMLEEARDPALRAAPIHWGSAQKGMVPGDELNDTDPCINWAIVYRRATGHHDYKGEEWITRRECCRRLWEVGSRYAANISEAMVEYTDPHKSIPNRMLAPYTHYNVLMTGTEPGWLNFFGLRLDGAADPIVRALAEAIWREWNESKPRTLRPGAWHLPYADDDLSFHEANSIYAKPSETLQKMSVARCAHLSYTSFETGERMTVDQCLRLYDRLVGSVPIHASPAEHQATPDKKDQNTITFLEGSVLEYLQDDPRAIKLKGEFEITPKWINGDKCGNLGPGWIQLRKMLPNEAIAPLPQK